MLDEEKHSMRWDRENLLGCLVGGALGDAVCSSWEGLGRGDRQIEPESFRLTDDTQLTIATCEAILTAGKVEPKQIATAFLRAFQSGGLTQPGASTLHALQGLASGGHWAMVGRKGEYAAGNGAAMRIASLAFFLDPTDYFDRRLIRDVVWVTHHHDEAYVGALAVVLGIWGIWNQRWDHEHLFVPLLLEELPDSRVRDQFVRMESLELNKLTVAQLAQEFGTSGYVVETIPLAFALTYKTIQSGFQSVLEHFICLDGDLDTIASICGQVAGAYLGYSQLPQELLIHLPQRESILTLGHQLFEMLM